MKPQPPVTGHFEADPFAARRTRVRTDGWENAITGLGTYERDKSMHARFERPNCPLSLQWEELSAIYHHDDICGRIIDTWPEHMFRCGWDLAVKEDKDRALAHEFEEKAKELKVSEVFEDATRWSSLFGGGVVIVGSDDGRPFDQPLDEENIKSIDWICELDRRFVQIDAVNWNTLNNFAEPEQYRVFSDELNPEALDKLPLTAGQALIHKSRIIRFPGAKTDRRERRILGGWDHSVLVRPMEKVKAFVQAFQAAGNIMTDASQGVFKLEGLIGQVSGGEVADLQTRMMMLDMGRSVARAILLDKDGEEFERTLSAITGYPDMLDRFMMLLSAATDGIPVTILMGRSAAGMNATGDSDFRQFYGAVKSKQTSKLDPRLQRLYRLMSLAKDGPTSGKESKFTITFRSLWEPTSLERAQINFVQAQADSLNVTMGSVTGEEVAINRFATGEINLNTVVDLAARREAMAAKLAFDPYENDPHQSADAQAEQAQAALDAKAKGPAVGAPSGEQTKVTNQAPSNEASKTRKP